MEEKRKLTKKEATSSFRRSCSTKGTSNASTRNPLLMRSSSLKFFSSSSSSPNCPFSRSSSPKVNSPKYSHSNFTRSFSQKGSSITRKCSSMAKEQRARFYIMRRCVAMLVCWHKHCES